MSSFAADIQIVCLGSLSLLVVYTLWLSRYRGLDGHLTVRWLLVEGGVLLTIIFWRWLPFFSLTSSVQDRALLLMVTVLLFAFVVFLMLDLLVRSSRQSTQIKRLTQELAIQRARLDAIACEATPAESQVILSTAPAAPSPNTDRANSNAQLWITLWIVLCLGFYVVDTFGYQSPAYPSSLKRFLSAAYLE
jgi:Uncharacterized conserved protein (DUF2304)